MDKWKGREKRRGEERRGEERREEKRREEKRREEKREGGRERKNNNNKKKTVKSNDTWAYRRSNSVNYAWNTLMQTLNMVHVFLKPIAFTTKRRSSNLNVFSMDLDISLLSAWS